ncbi:unnamed protein product, partial [Heterosigma akashiwo]
RRLRRAAARAQLRSGRRPGPAQRGAALLRRRRVLMHRAFLGCVQPDQRHPRPPGALWAQGPVGGGGVAGGHWVHLSLLLNELLS